MLSYHKCKKVASYYSDSTDQLEATLAIQNPNWKPLLDLEHAENKLHNFRYGYEVKQNCTFKSYKLYRIWQLKADVISKQKLKLLISIFNYYFLRWQLKNNLTTALLRHNLTSKTQAIF